MIRLRLDKAISDVKDPEYISVLHTQWKYNVSTYSVGEICKVCQNEDLPQCGLEWSDTHQIYNVVISIDKNNILL